MVTDSAALLMLAIRSGLKLSGQIRLAYVDATKRRELVLPLPNFETKTDWREARDFFTMDGFGPKFLEGYVRVQTGTVVPGNPRLKTLVTRAVANGLNDSEKGELAELHTQYACLLTAEEQGQTWSDGRPADPDELSALLSVRQWQNRRNDPNPPALQRIAGTLVEIGIEYALQTPQLADPKSSRGRALAGFLSGLDQQIDFAEGDLAEVPARLMIATVDSLSQNAGLLSGDPKVQELIQATTRGLTTALADQLKAIEGSDLTPTEKHAAKLRAKDWGEVIFRSTLSTGGRMVLSDPGTFLGLRGAAGQALVVAVGNDLLDLVLEEDGKLSEVFGRDGLEVVLHSALEVVAQQPGLFPVKNPGFRQLLIGLATDLQAIPKLVSPDLFPEVARLVLDRTAENLDLFWPEREDHPERNLLAAAAKTTLTLLTRTVPGATWKPQFRREDLLTVVNSVLDEFVNHPGWLIDAAGEVRPALQEVLKGVVEVLRRRADNRLTPATAVEVLQVLLQSASLRLDFLEKLPDGTPVIVAVTDTILSTVFDPDQDPAVAWRLLGRQTLSEVVEVTLRVMADHSLTPAAAVKKLGQALTAEIRSLVNDDGFDLESFATALAKKLAA
ncbi:MAG: hypothetical protein J0M24_27645 [Verrucomicrobia bacterium]|nr:hypothetical protein [Verrucomicrobiota bacterium]